MGTAATMPLRVTDKEAADQAAVDSMRKVLASIPMDGVVVIGEGEKDEAPMLYCGEKIGDGSWPKVDIAVDPLDGTRLVAHGGKGALSVIALAARGSLFDPGPCVYMDKLAVGPALAGVVDLRNTVSENITASARKLGKELRELSVVVLDRPRHRLLIQEIRNTGARVLLIQDGDVEAAISTAQEHTGIDMLMGVGGSPEGVIAACALTCMGGAMQGRLCPRDDAERVKAMEMGLDVTKVLDTHDLVGQSDDVFFAASGVTNGDLLRGVCYTAGGAITHSIVMRAKSGTVRLIETTHKWSKPGITNL